MLKLARYSFGVGDRFAQQAEAQLQAFEKLAALGKSVSPVWNKSNREHTFVGSEPASVRRAAQSAVSDGAGSIPGILMLTTSSSKRLTAILIAATSSRLMWLIRLVLRLMNQPSMPFSIGTPTC